MLRLYRLHPVLVWAIVLCLDFGAIMFIRVVFEGNLYFTRWYAFYIGDTVCLPLFAAFAAAAIRRGGLRGLSLDEWWPWLLLILGWILSLLIEINAMNGGRDPAITKLPSQLYHTFIFGVMVCIIVWGIVAVWIVMPRHKAFLAACMFLVVLYGVTAIADNIPALQNVEPEKLQDRK